MELDDVTNGVTANSLAEFAIPVANRRVERALVVDDERINRLMLSRILEQNGIEVDEASSGEEALEALSNNGSQYNIVLLDISMPGMDGFEALVNIRRSICESELPVIMVTSTSDRSDIIKAFDYGANDYLTKPIDAGITAARVKTHLKLLSARLELTESQERFALAMLGSRDGIWDWNLVTDEVFYSPRWKTMLGLPEDYPVKQLDDMLNRIHIEDRSRVEEALQQHVAGEIPHFETELRVRHHGDSYRWMLFRGQAFRNKEGQALRVAGSLTDITEGKVADALTGLPNRLMFDEKIELALDRYRRNPSRLFCVMYLDLDNFKLVNDSHGHQAGDELLLATAYRLCNSLRRSDSMVARLGGDEFAVILTDIEECSVPALVAERILTAMEKPFELECGAMVFAGISVGISIVSDRSKTREDLLREADTAMYQAKASGKNCFRLYDPRMHDSVRRRLSMESDLRSAVERGELLLYFQPIINLSDRRVIGAESLVRWKHPTRGMVMPGEFIRLAEETGLIQAIGRWVVREACEKLASWMPLAKQFEDFRVHVNVSTRQFTDGTFIELIRDAMADNQIGGHQLGIEITESLLVDQAECARRFLDELASMGVCISVDDFGTGYSSLSSLREDSLDVIKIDRSFIEHMDSQANGAVVRAICELANGLGLQALAEGIETEQQLETARGLGCQQGQGYLLCHPLPSHELVEKLLAADFFLRSDS